MRVCYVLTSLLLLLSIHLIPLDTPAYYTYAPATSRQAVMDSSWIYVTLKWTCYNTFTSTNRGNFYEGRQYTGEAYLFGGRDDWKTFLHKVEVQKLRPRQAAGIDCSSFVSRCWGILPRNTEGLAEISHAIPRHMLKPADILDNIGGTHVVLVESLTTDYSVIVRESIGGTIARVVRQSTTWSRYDGYIPFTLVDLSPDSSAIEEQAVGASDPGDLRIRARIWNDGAVPISGAVHFYADDLGSPIGVDTVQVDSRTWGDVQIPWEVGDLSAGEHRIFVRVGDTRPVESDTTNNQVAVSYVLPLTLSSIEAEVRGDQVRVQWTTQAEWENRGFRLYRALNTGVDSLSYRPIHPDLIPGAGTTSVPHTYAFVDTGIIHEASYAYTLTAITTEGREIPYHTLFVTSPSSVLVSEPSASPSSLPTTYTLRQNWPNPFNTSTTIGYALPERVEVTLTVYDILGREIRRWAYGDREAGYHSEQWDGVDSEGNVVSSGIYLYRLRAGAFMETKRMILMK